MNIPCHPSPSISFMSQEIRYSSNIAAQIQLYNLPLYLLSSLPKELPDTWITTTRENLYFGGLRIQETGEILLLVPSVRIAP